MDTTRERLIGRHNRITTNQSGLCRTLLGFAIMIAITVSLLITGLVLTGQGMLYQPKYHIFSMVAFNFSFEDLTTSLFEETD